MSAFYANITLQGPPQDDVVAFLRERGDNAYVAPTVKNATVIFHEDMGAQEQLAAELSSKFECPALVVMSYGEGILLYTLFVNGARADGYVSTPHEDLDLVEDAPEGNPQVLCEAFGRERSVYSVEKILRRVTDPKNPVTLAANRHGELARALNLPLLAAGASYRGIEVGEMPGGPDFDAGNLVRTPR
jgi:hypothetical protein